MPSFLYYAMFFFSLSLLSCNKWFQKIPLPPSSWKVIRNFEERGISKAKGSTFTKWWGVGSLIPPKKFHWERGMDIFSRNSMMIFIEKIMLIFCARFIRNLLYFYKPSSQRFCTVHISDPQARTFSEVGCLLVDFLLESEDVRHLIFTVICYIQLFHESLSYWQQYCMVLWVLA